MRGHVCFRDELGPRRPFTRSPSSHRFRDARSHCALDPRPRPSSRFAMFTRSADKRFSGSDCRPTTSATALSTHGHTLEHPILAFVRASRFRSDLESALAFHQAFGAQRPSPVEEGLRVRRAATVPSKSVVRRCKHAAKRDLESCRPIATPLAGDASIRPPFAAMAVGRQRWTGRAESL